MIADRESKPKSKGAFQGFYLFQNRGVADHGILGKAEISESRTLKQTVICSA